MRTQLILTTAALGLAGAIGAQAQVYSVNAVGYINATVPANGFAIVANQLNAGGNTIAEVIPTASNFTTVYKYDSATGNYDLTSWLITAWDKPTMALPPGTAFFVSNPDAAAQTLTFVGEVPTGTLTTQMAKGFTLAGSQVPQAGKLQTDLGYAPAMNDTVYLFDTAKQAYDIYTYLGVWLPAEPTLAVGQGAFFQKEAASTWTRTFSIN